MRLQWIICIAAPCLVGACSSAPTGLASTRDVAVMVDDLNDPAWPRDLIALDSAVVTSEGRLRLFTTYGGGCADHAAALLVHRAFMESQPPALRARVAHDARGDMCRALVAWTLEFDLHPVRSHYQRSYGSSSGSVALDIGGARVTYVFE